MKKIHMKSQKQTIQKNQKKKEVIVQISLQKKMKRRIIKKKKKDFLIKYLDLIQMIKIKKVQIQKQLKLLEVLL